MIPSPWAHLHMVGTLWFMSDVNQLSLLTPFYSVLVSVSVFMALSIVFHSINSPDNSPFSHSVLVVLALPHWSFQLSLFMEVSFSPDIICSGWLGSNHKLTNKHYDFILWYMFVTSRKYLAKPITSFPILSCIDCRMALLSFMSFLSLFFSPTIHCQVHMKRQYPSHFQKEQTRACKT